MKGLAIECGGATGHAHVARATTGAPVAAVETAALAGPMTTMHASATTLEERRRKSMVRPLRIAPLASLSERNRWGNATNRVSEGAVLRLLEHGE